MTNKKIESGKRYVYTGIIDRVAFTVGKAYVSPKDNKLIDDDGDTRTVINSSLAFDVVENNPITNLK